MIINAFMRFQSKNYDGERKRTREKNKKTFCNPKMIRLKFVDFWQLNYRSGAFFVRINEKKTAQAFQKYYPRL